MNFREHLPCRTSLSERKFRALILLNDLSFQPVQNADIELPDALKLVLEKDFFAITNDRQV